MYYSDRDGSSGFALGMLTGALVGAGLALLFAPKPGADVRSDLTESMGTLRDAVTRRVRDMADRAGVELENLQDSVDRVTHAVESTANDVINSAYSAADSAASAAQRARG